VCLLPNTHQSTSTILTSYDGSGINIDDCWPSGRSEEGVLEWNTTIFPKGLPWLVDYVKSKGFHMGIYSDAGVPAFFTPSSHLYVNLSLYKIQAT
jgi:hypothetical protein